MCNRLTHNQLQFKQEEAEEQGPPPSLEPPSLMDMLSGNTESRKVMEWVQQQREQRKRQQERQVDDQVSDDDQHCLSALLCDLEQKCVRINCNSQLHARPLLNNATD